MRILIADDSELVRRGIITLLSEEKRWQVCGEVADGSHAVQKARELLPDLILLDISMPGLNGLEAASLLRQDLPQTKILILSQHDPSYLRSSAAAAGADDCLDKTQLGTDLLAAIRKLENE